MVKKTFAYSALLGLSAALLLVACGGGNVQAPLTGEREQIVTTVTLFEPEPALVNTKLNIPSAQDKSDWPQANGNAENGMPHVALPEKVTPAWQKNVMAGVSRDEALVNPPVIAEGRLFIMTPASEVIALDAWNGKTLWEEDLRAKDREDRGLAASGGLGVSDGVLYATTSGGQVFALNAENGNLIWRAEVGASVRAAPTISGERVFVVSHDNRLHVLDSKSGQLLWNHSGIEEPLAILGGAAPAVAGGVVAVPYSSGEVYILKASDGRYLWHDSLSSVAAYDPYININDIVAAPVIADGVLYVANTSGQMAALSIERGQELWRRDYSARGTPVVAGNAIYVLTTGGQMLGLHRDTGRVKWVMELGKVSLKDNKTPVSWFGPVLAGGRLMAISSDGYAVSVSPEDGRKLALRKLAKGASVPPVVADKILYFLTDEGELLAYD